MSGASSHLSTKIVRAGAGAGKTTSLVNTVTEILNESFTKGEKPPSIIITTFTRKATQELRERLFIQAMKSPYSEQFTAYLQNSRNILISTIHGVLATYLKSYGHWMGLNPQFSLVGESKNRKLIKKILKDLIAQNENAHQAFEKLLDHGDASSWIQYFMAWSDAKLIYPKLRFADTQVLHEIQLKKLQGFQEELKNIADRMEAECDNEKWVEWARAQKHFLNQSASLSLAAWVEAFAEANAPFKGMRKTAAVPEDLVERRKDLYEDTVKYSGYKTSEDFIRAHQSLAESFQLVAELLTEKFVERKIQSSALTMPDLEGFALRLIRTHPASANEFSKEWDFWMVDEFQDTSPLQLEILEALIQKKPVYFVGDPQQSIYLFRGARSELFHKKEKQFQEKKMATQYLLKNYRSNKPILSFFNQFFAALDSQFFSMEVGKPEEKQRSEKNTVQVYQAADKQQEALAAVRMAADFIARGEKPHDIAILARKHDVLMDCVKAAKEIGLDVQLQSSQKFFEKREVMDALSLFHFLANPHDNVNFIRLAHGPWFAIENDILTQIRETSYWVEICRKFPTHTTVMALKTLLLNCQSIGLIHSWKNGILQSQMLDCCRQIDPTGKLEANLWKLITWLQLEERKPGFSPLHILDAIERGDLDVEANEGVSVIENQRVQLMTVHASKGLQFENVILLGLASPLKPDIAESWMLDEARGMWTVSPVDFEEGKKTSSLFGDQILQTRNELRMAEYKRVLYVALTRAQHRVMMIWSDVRNMKNSWAQSLKNFLEQGLQHPDFEIEKHESLPEVQKIEQENLRSVSLANLRKPLSMQDVVESQKINPSKQMSEGAAPLPTSKSLEKAAHGVQIHQLFESIHYLGFEKVRAEFPEHTEIMDFVRTHNQGEILNIIKTGFVEWGFVTNNVRGQIDLWGYDSQNRLCIVDFKTGSSQYLEKAQAQLQVYADVLKKIKKVDGDIRLLAVYPYERKVIEL